VSREVVAASNIQKSLDLGTHAFHSVHIYKSQEASTDTSNEHSLSPLSTDAESQSHYTFSPLEHRKLSMLSGESNSEDDVEDEDFGIFIKEDARLKHLWEEISDFKEKTDILQKKKTMPCDGPINKGMGQMSSNVSCITTVISWFALELKVHSVSYIFMYRKIQRILPTA
jgi:hypothetical protein